MSDKIWSFSHGTELQALNECSKAKTLRQMLIQTERLSKGPTPYQVLLSCQGAQVISPLPQAYQYSPDSEDKRLQAMNA